MIAKESVKGLMRGQVLVERLTGKDQKTVGGIWLPDNINELPLMCQVVMVGPDHYVGGERMPAVMPQIKVGDIVGVRQWERKTVNLVDKNLIVVDGYDIFGVFDATPWAADDAGAEHVTSASGD